MWSNPHDGVDMTVGVIADEVAVVEPYNAVSLEEILQKFLQMVAVERLVAVRSQEALRRGEDGTLAIALDAATFEYETLVVVDGAVLESSLVVEVERDGIVFLPSELLAPAVKLEVEERVRHHEACVA